MLKRFVVVDNWLGNKQGGSVAVEKFCTPQGMQQLFS